MGDNGRYLRSINMFKFMIRNVRLPIIFYAFSFPVHAYEINTHQAMIHCAVTAECHHLNQERSENLHSFIKNDALLASSNYSDEQLYGYGKTYLDYARTGEDVFKKFKINFVHGGNYIDMLQAGAVLEDAVWPGQDAIAFGGDGRFNSHFHDPQQYGAPLTIRYGQRTDAITWALEGETLGEEKVIGVRTNRYSLQQAYDYYRESFNLFLDSRRKSAQAALFVSLGHIVHLLQDLHSTAHTRDDSHPQGDALEVYARATKDGFNLINGRLNPHNNALITDAIQTQPWITDTTYYGFFKNTADFTSENFFSANTISLKHAILLHPTLHIPSLFSGYPNDIIAYTNWFDHPLPDLDQLTLETRYENTGGIVSTTGYYYLHSTTVEPSKLAIRRKGNLYTDEVIRTAEDSTVLEENAINLIPKAIGATEGFFNYFFRGRLEAKVSDDGENLELSNISNPELVRDASYTTFNAGGVIDLYYQTDAKDNKLLLHTILANSLAVGETYLIEGFAGALEFANDIGEEGKIIVLFDGKIGFETGLAVTHVQIDTLDNIIVSDFDDTTYSNDGWDIGPKAAGLDWNNCGSAEKVLSGGNPKGFITHTEYCGSPYIANDAWYFIAPGKFLGDQSKAYGYRLSFDLKSSYEPYNVIVTTPFVVLSGAGKHIFLRVGVDYSAPLDSWTQYSIPLFHNAFINNWRVSSSNLLNHSDPATEQDIREVLGDITGLHILGTYGRNSTTRIDNIKFGAE